MILYLDRSQSVSLRYSPGAKLRQWAWRLRNTWSPAYGGALGVQRNLERELTMEPGMHWAAGQEAEPRAPVAVGWVLRSLRDLHRGIRLKKEGRIRQLWVGPNLIVVPQEAGEALAAPEIDACIVPCAWAAALYEKEMPALSQKLTLWPVGIDTDYWQPSFSDAQTRVVIYNKNEPALTDAVARHLDALTVPYTVIRYGDYTPETYRETLRHASGLIWLSASETEGLACLEALSMNVPVLAWSPGIWTYDSPVLKRRFSAPATSVPYFSPRCGETFAAPEEFPVAFDRFWTQRAAYQPRAWLLSESLDLKTNLRALAPLKEL